MNTDILQSIASSDDWNVLLQFCQTNKLLNKLLENDEFWRITAPRHLLDKLPPTGIKSYVLTKVRPIEWLYDKLKNKREKYNLSEFECSGRLSITTNDETKNRKLIYGCNSFGRGGFKIEENILTDYDLDRDFQLLHDKDQDDYNDLDVIAEKIIDAANEVDNEKFLPWDTALITAVFLNAVVLYNCFTSVVNKDPHTFVMSASSLLLLLPPTFMFYAVNEDNHKIRAKREK